MRPGVNVDFMTHGRQTDGQFFNVPFDPTLDGGNAFLTDHGDLHGLVVN
jgi:hypothetical protein